MTNFKKSALVVTSIASPNAVLSLLASGAKTHQITFYVIGDVSSPEKFELDGCHFYSIEKQRQLEFAFAKKCPERHYSRKNIGYLLAMQEGADLILETDDDNFPMPSFWEKRKRKHLLPVAINQEWLNVYQYFTDKFIWPRGFALEKLQDKKPEMSSFNISEVLCPIQQGLANDNPDVDAIYRLTYPLPFKFRSDQFSLAIGKGTWCPFNSQNTSWFKEAFPLLYLPSFCSFRMTDIWRSFIAQRILWENEWYLLFHSPSVWQDRNDHNLMKDFQDEIPGYLNNYKIADNLAGLSLLKGKENIPENLLICYQKLIDTGVILPEELTLLKAWLSDLQMLNLI